MRRPLVPEPVFLLSAPRSGSTLLRCMLDTHSQIRAPQELHLKHLSVRLGSADARLSLELLGYPERELRHLLWDRLLHAELLASGKSVLVEKSPCAIDIVDELRRCWPRSRFLLLLRHPAHAAQSMIANLPGYRLGSAVARLRRMDEVRRELGDEALRTIRYEELVAHPRATLHAICERLSLRFEPDMIDYGRQDHGPFRYGTGDWGDRIRGGVPTVPRKYPAVPGADLADLADLARSWGYPPGED